MTTRKPKPPDAGDLLAIHLKELGLNFMREALFHGKRKWRFDFLVSGGIAVEIEGAVWQQGRHTRGAGFLKDCEKYNTAAMMGYRVLRFSTQQVLRGEAKEFIKSWPIGS